MLGDHPSLSIIYGSIRLQFNYVYIDEGKNEDIRDFLFYSR